MSRSQTTGAYTRVDNSFSNPVIGTTISPTDADTFFDDVESAVNAFLGTSTTSLAIGTGAKTFTIASDVANKVFLANTHIHAFSLANTANYMDCTVTSYNNSTGALVTDCFAIGGSGTITDWVIISSGARGATGATGAQGPTSGLQQTYSTTTADADPGAGVFRLNNATPASATAAYLDNLDTGGATVSTVFDLWDDSTNTVKGAVLFKKSTDATVWAMFNVTGSVVDGTGYRKLTLANGAGSGAFTNGDTFAITFFRAGDKGADGTVAGPGVSVDSEIALWSGTGGATLKRATGSGVATVTSGVLGVAGTSTTATFGTIELGAATDTTLGRISAGVFGVEGVAITPNIPQSSKSVAYTTVLADANTHILHPSSDNNARTFTIDSNANVAYPIGTTLTFVNKINTVTIAITTDTLTWAGPGTTGSRTLAANGMATAMKIATTEWMISGSGLT
jgi:hypothetical protein